jgi:nicotinate-nucleotide adenylyltransferase
MTQPALTGPIGIFGGTFDPLHNGHLHIATTALAQLPIERVRWIPSGDPGHRHAPIAGGAHRLEMVRRAIATEPRFELDSSEVASGAPTFTVPLLRRLREAWGPKRSIVLISGADSFLSLPTWREWQTLFSLAHIAVAARPGYSLDVATMDPLLRPEFEARQSAAASLKSTPAGRIALFSLPPLPISATDLRNRLARGEQPMDLLPSAVLAYIQTNRLYRAP